MDPHDIRPTRYRTAAERLVQARSANLQDPQGGPHGMEPVATIAGVDYVDDSRSTHLDATLRSISHFEQPVIWIAGGIAADVSRSHIQEFLRDRVAALVLFGRSGNVGIEALKPFTEHMYSVEDLRTAVFVARELAREGEVVLFSPACPSSEDFANYQERGMAFQRAVRDL